MADMVSGTNSVGDEPPHLPAGNDMFQDRMQMLGTASPQWLKAMLQANARPGIG